MGRNGSGCGEGGVLWSKILRERDLESESEKPVSGGNISGIFWRGVQGGGRRTGEKYRDDGVSWGVRGTGGSWRHCQHFGRGLGRRERRGHVVPSSQATGVKTDE